MTTLLVVDDDQHIRELMVLYLKNEGFQIIEAQNGALASEIFQTQSIDLVILDVMMPRMDGWELLHEIRSLDLEIPLLMVTAKSETPHKLKGFRLGTDDYLTKPFDPLELVMRVKALLKRAKINSSQIIKIKNFKLDQQTYEIGLKADLQSLPPKEFELLFLLASYPSQIFTREQLITRIWGSDYAGDDRTVDVHIKRIRQRIAPFSNLFEIQAARGLGYRLVIK